MKRLLPLFLAACLLLPLGAAAQTAYSFPYAGVRLALPDGWTLLCPETLPDQAKLLASVGVSEDALRADWSANHTVFELFLPGSIQVSLSVIETEDTAAWGDSGHMTGAQSAAFLKSYDHAPYQNVSYVNDPAGFLQCEWALEAGGETVTFARLMAVRQGALYMLTAMGLGISADALHAAGREALSALTFLGARAGAKGAAGGPETPAPIADDGKVTPLALVDFAGVTLSDLTTIYLKTLPGAEVALKTATDTLRGKADADGNHSFTVSTRRESTYTYTLSANTSGRKQSEMTVSVERRLSGEALEAAYKTGARTLDALGGYSRILGDAKAFAGQAITFRGQVAEVSEMQGFPAVLVYSVNPGKGVWRDPVWAVLVEPVQQALKPGDVFTFYGDLRGDTTAHKDEEGKAAEAPVMACRSVVP